MKSHTKNIAVDASVATLNMVLEKMEKLRDTPYLTKGEQIVALRNWIICLKGT